MLAAACGSTMQGHDEGATNQALPSRALVHDFNIISNVADNIYTMLTPSTNGSMLFVTT